MTKINTVFFQLYIIEKNRIKLFDYFFQKNQKKLKKFKNVSYFFRLIFKKNSLNINGNSDLSKL